MPDTGYRLIQVPVALGERRYDIAIGHDWLDQFAAYLPQSLFPIEHAVCICDSQIESSWGRKIAAVLQTGTRRVDILTVPSGENSKSAEQLVQLWNALLESRADRKTVVFAIGGGVVGDLAGMTAATFVRGLRLVQIPTTLLSQVDSSVGGKTGINLPKAKNMVGAFWQPSFVAIDTHTLSTLPERETRSGWAEIVKYGVILDADFFEYLESHINEILAHDPEVYAHAIRRSCELKAQVVVADELETTGLRAVLNYGHTFAHAIEATSGYGEWLHGEAVSIGMQMAMRLAAIMGRVPSSLVNRQRNLLENLKLPVELPHPDIDALIKAMQHDKKVAHGKLRFVLPTRIGHVELVSDSIDRGQVARAIKPE